MDPIKDFDLSYVVKSSQKKKIGAFVSCVYILLLSHLTSKAGRVKLGFG